MTHSNQLLIKSELQRMDKIERFVTLLSEGVENEDKIRLALTDNTVWTPFGMVRTGWYTVWTGVHPRTSILSQNLTPHHGTTGFYSPQIRTTSAALQTNLLPMIQNLRVIPHSIEEG